VLSSYLLTSLALREIQATGEFNIIYFFKRRILRIWPLYFLGLGIGFFVYPLVSFLAFGNAPNFWDGIKFHLLPFVFFFGNFSYPAFSEYLGRYSSLWTINLEEQFYLVLPLLVTVFLIPYQKRRVFILCLVGLTIPVLTRTYFSFASIPYPWHWVSPVTRFDPFFIGLGAAVIDSKYQLRGRLCYFSFCIAILLFTLISSFPSMQFTAHNIWQLSASGLFGVSLLLAARMPLLRSMLSAKGMIYLGKISFGLYVYHRYLLDFFTQLAAKAGVSRDLPIAWVCLFSVCLAGTIAISAISYKFFESYFLRKKSGVEVVQTRLI
jgi:peptidoglycan/LPS O-acetylase OafA/YrhL